MFPLTPHISPPRNNASTETTTTTEGRVMIKKISNRKEFSTEILNKANERITIKFAETAPINPPINQAFIKQLIYYSLNIFRIPNLFNFN